MNSNTYNNIAQELKSFFTNNAFFRVLLPFDVVFVFGSLAIMLINSFIGINIGSLIPAILPYTFWLGIIIAYSNFHHIFVYVGLFAYSTINVLTLIRFLIGHGRFIWEFFVAGSAFFILGYMSYKHSKSSGSSSAGFNI